MSTERKLIVGLGNPDPEHAGTRHNLGWMVADALAKRLDGTWQSKPKFKADVAEIPRGLIVKPTTYMNLSGEAVQALTSFYKTELKDLLIVCDDINLPFGDLRFRDTGSAGGQKGLASVLTALGTQDVSRLRIGVGAPPGPDATPHVLGKFTPDEQARLPVLITQALDRIEEWRNE